MSLTLPELLAAHELLKDDATPGPWTREDGSFAYVIANGAPLVMLDTDKQGVADADYLASVSPEVMAAYIAVAEEHAQWKQWMRSAMFGKLDASDAILLMSANQSTDNALTEVLQRKFGGGE